jgi:hypothetical protein
MLYDEFKYKVFKVINNSSRSNITLYLHYLSNDYNIPYSVVVDDFNYWNNNYWGIEYE